MVHEGENTDGVDGWDFILALDDELLQGGHVLSEWAASLCRNADVAYVAGAYVAAAITAVAAVEAHLRSEATAGGTSAALISNSDLNEPLKADLHAVRRYRNAWVHVDDPWDDAGVLQEFDQGEPGARLMARLALRSMREVLYSTPCV